MSETTARDVFLTPGDLCQRWEIDYRTLRKLTLPWVVLAPTKVRRVALDEVKRYETAQRFAVHHTS